MADWDADDFEPEEVKVPIAGPTDKWAGEDEEANPKDNWDDEDNEKKEETPGSTVVMKKKKKPIGERLKEKEEKKRKEMEEKRKKEEEQVNLTSEEIYAEKMRQLRLQEESDLELAKEAFGVKDNALEKPKIDTFHPVTREDFEKLAKMLKEKLTVYESSVNYPGFLEMVFRDLVAGLNSDDIKKLGSTLNAVANEKQKQQKNTKGKKKKKGPSVKEGGQMVNYDEEGFGDEFDSFM